MAPNAAWMRLALRAWRARDANRFLALALRTRMMRANPGVPMACRSLSQWRAEHIPMNSAAIHKNKLIDAPASKPIGAC